MKFLIAFVLTLSTCAVQAHTLQDPTVKSGASRLTDFVPAGWKILSQAKGDLNKDGLMDAALILEKSVGSGVTKKRGAIAPAPPRMLVILFHSPEHKGYAVSARSDSFISLHDDPETDDPFADISIARGILNIDFRYNRSDSHDDISTSTYKFRYDGHHFVLIGADVAITGRMSFTFQKYSYNFLSRKGIFTTGPLGEGADETLTKTVRLPAPKTLDTFSKPGTWTIGEDFIL